MSSLEIFQLTPDIHVGHLGPPKETGPLPTVIYFGLSLQESLTTDPFNQPVVYLQNFPVRILSLNLPAHGPNLNALDAMYVWAKEISSGNDIISSFIDQCIYAINTLIERKLILREKIGVMGLSRGGFIAAHLALKFPQLRAIVGFAPMTTLTSIKEFNSLDQSSLVQTLNLQNHLSGLCDKTMRFYIGNRDTRVSTDECYTLVRKLADTAFEQGLRSPPIEMIISPSIGHMGHGTPKEIFIDGAHWIGKKLGVIRDKS